MQKIEPILTILPPELREAVRKLDSEHLEELRFRAGKRPCAVFFGREQVLDAPAGTKQQLEQLIGAASGHSSFAALGEGYLTLPQGHRIGFCGEAVVKEGKITNFRAPSSVNIRIAREFRGVSESLLQEIGMKPQNLLLIGPPGSGKTTFLRDLIRLYADRLHQRVCVADERGELAAVRDGVPGFDVGQHTDILTGGPRAQAMELLLRVMNPSVLAMDEIVSESERDALLAAGRCGVYLLATAHAGSLKELQNRQGMSGLQELFPLVGVICNRTIRLERWEC